jgi:hypothetical protein
VPVYLTDLKFIGTVDISAGTARIFLRQKNRDWCPGDGNFFITAVCGGRVLLTEAGQRRGKFALETRYHWLDLDSGKMAGLALAGELAKNGRGVGYIYLVKEDGTLILVTPPLGTPVGEPWHRHLENTELWMRLPNGTYARVAVGAEYYGFYDDGIYYWDLAAHAYRVYDLRTGEYRDAGKYDPGLFDQAAHEPELRVASDGKSLEIYDGNGQGRKIAIPDLK